jgi:hypothetical protein
MQRKSPLQPCPRRYVPALLRARIMLRQNGRCFDCGTRLMLGRIIFDHRPPLALRGHDENANDPERLAAICRSCDQRKTPRDLKDIAKTRRLALDHQEFAGRMQDKVPGRPVPSKGQWQRLKQEMNRGADLRVACRSEEITSAQEGASRSHERNPLK